MMSAHNTQHSSHAQHTHGVGPRVSFGSRTDIGCVREHNEDSLLVRPPLYVVCDGMGGHAAGEVASELAVRVLAEQAPNTADAERLGQAVEEANLTIIQAAKEGVGKSGMGTTCTAAVLEDRRLVIAQVGDSRAYLLHNGALQQITRDHSLVADLVEAGQITPEQARIHPNRSIITRALGSDPHMMADLYEINVAEGDRLLLCSDGLYSMISDDEIARILRDCRNSQQAADALAQAAIKAGGYDNVTTIVVDVADNSEACHTKLARKTKVTMGVIVGLFAAAFIAAAVGFNLWIGNSAYLGEVDGRIAVYQGVPGDLFGVTFNSMREVTDVAVDDLQPGLANRIRQNDIRCDSLSEAYVLVGQYRQDIQNKSEVPQSGTGSHPAAEDSTGESAQGAGETAGEGAAGETAGASAAAAATSMPDASAAEGGNA